MDEFYAQGQIEKDSNIPTSLFGGPPDPDSLLQKAQSQIGFMTAFALPLFGGLARVLPGLGTAVDEINRNKAKWQETVALEASSPMTSTQQTENQRFANTKAYGKGSQG